MSIRVSVIICIAQAGLCHLTRMLYLSFSGMPEQSTATIGFISLRLVDACCMPYVFALCTCRWIVMYMVPHSKARWCSKVVHHSDALGGSDSVNPVLSHAYPSRCRTTFWVAVQAAVVCTCILARPMVQYRTQPVAALTMPQYCQILVQLHTVLHESRELHSVCPAEPRRWLP